MNTNRESAVKKWFIPAVAVAVSGMAIAALPAQATLTPTVWTHTASSCVPDDASIGRYDTHVSDIKHKGTSLGQIVTRCNVENLPAFGAGGTPKIEVVLRDQDGHGNAQRATVTLVRAHDDGTTTPVVTVDSNNYLGSSLTKKRTVYFRHNYDFRSNSYYVEIRVSRTTSNVFPIVSSVRLSS